MTARQIFFHVDFEPSAHSSGDRMSTMTNPRPSVSLMSAMGTYAFWTSSATAASARTTRARVERLDEFFMEALAAMREAEKAAAARERHG